MSPLILALALLAAIDDVQPVPRPTPPIEVTAYFEACRAAHANSIASEEQQLRDLLKARGRDGDRAAKIKQTRQGIARLKKQTPSAHLIDLRLRVPPQKGDAGTIEGGVAHCVQVMGERTAILRIFSYESGGVRVGRDGRSFTTLPDKAVPTEFILKGRATDSTADGTGMDLPGVYRCTGSETIPIGPRTLMVLEPLEVERWRKAK